MAKRLQLRDASGRFVSRATWELAYRLTKQPVPKRVGVRNRTAPLTRERVQELSIKRPRVASKKQLQQERKGKGRQRDETTGAGKAAPAGTEFELTATYKGARGKGRDHRALHIKIRVVLTVPMLAETARQLLDRAVQTGRVPPGIDVQWLDWSRPPKGGGTYDDPDSVTLKSFYGAIGGANKSATRFAKVAESERDL